MFLALIIINLIIILKSENKWEKIEKLKITILYKLHIIFQMIGFKKIERKNETV